MKITILATGTRGDVQPYIALGAGLQSFGHQVCIAASKDFAELIRQVGLAYYPIDVDVKAILNGAEGQALMKKGANPLQFIHLYRQLTLPYIERYLQDAWQACQTTNALIASPLSFGASTFATCLDIPYFLAKIQPVGHTRVFPNPVTPQNIRLGKWYNWLTYEVMQQLFGITFRKPVSAWLERNLNTPPLPFLGSSRQAYRNRKPRLFGFSNAVVPKPYDWPDWWHVTGYWHLDLISTWQPPDKLKRFLAAGPPPVYIGFGSMKGEDPQTLTHIALKALEQTGQRGIILTGWGGLSEVDLPETVLNVENVPHDWLFPKMSAVVHHGGSGTTAAALRAGVPSIVLPFMADQPFWGHRVAQLGVGPNPIPQKKLTVEGLAQAIQAATQNQTIRDRAHELGHHIRSEDGVAEAIKIFNQVVSGLN